MAKYDTDERNELARRIHVAADDIHKRTLRSGNYVLFFEGKKAIELYERYKDTLHACTYHLVPIHGHFPSNNIRLVQYADYSKFNFDAGDKETWIKQIHTNECQPAMEYIISIDDLIQHAPLYLEISPRQSGKSTRMIAHAYKRAQDGEYSVIFARNHENVKNLIRMWQYLDAGKPIEIGMKYVKFISTQAARETLRLDIPPDSVLYFDEFDFYDQKALYCIEDMMFSGKWKCYFCTTAARSIPADIIYGDVHPVNLLARLIRANNFRYEQFPCLNKDIQSAYKSAYKSYFYGNEHFKREILGTFIS